MFSLIIGTSPVVTGQCNSWRFSPAIEFNLSDPELVQDTKQTNVLLINRGMSQASEA